MLDACRTIGHQIHVHVVERTAFSNHQHASVTRSLDDHLSLRSAGLVVVFDTDGPLSLEAINHGFGVIERFNGVKPCTLCPIDDFAG